MRAFEVKIGLPGNKAGQSLVETALVLPIVLFLVFGVFELGRIVFIFSALNNASREAARFGAATGITGSNVATYLDCAAIRQRARETAFLAGLTDDDIDIAYDTPDESTDGMTVFASCGDQDLDASDVRQGDRIIVTISRRIDPVLSFLPFPQFNPTFVTARTIMKDIVIGPVECSDGVDNDGDGFIDWPDDPGCSSPDDTTEAQCFRLSVVTSPLVGGNLSISREANCANRYIAGTPVDVQAFLDIRDNDFSEFYDPANPGLSTYYTFDRWEGPVDDGSGSRVNPARVTMNADKDITAHFRLLENDLSVTKTSSIPPEIPVGALKEIRYTLVVSNASGGDPAHLVRLVDTLPAGVTYLSWNSGTDPRWGCTEPLPPNEFGETPAFEVATDIVCEFIDPMNDSLAAGDSVSFEIRILSPVVNETTWITNRATVTAYEYEDPSNLDNNISEVTNQIVPRAELTLIRKEGPTEEVPADTEFDFTITVGNAGPSIATNVRITDDLLGNFTFIPESSDDRCGASGTVVTCVIPELIAGDIDTVTFTVRAPRNGTTFLNSASVTANEAEDETGDNTRDAERETEIYSHVDLDISKTGPTSVYRDVPFSYQLTVSNAGPSTAENVRIVDTLPEGISFNSFLNHSGSGSCGRDGQIFTCSFGGIQSGHSRVITLNVVAVSEGTFDNTATVSTDTVTDDGSVLSATVTTAATTVVGLGIDKQAPSSVVAGDLFVYTIDVRNDGPSNATGVSVVDQLPANVAFEQVVEAAGWTCGHADGVVTCTPNSGTLLPGAEGAATLELEVRVTSAANTSVTNTARLHANEEDPVSDSATTVITPAFDLSLEAEEPSSAGAPFTFYLYVANLGPRTATNVLVSDTLSGVTGGTVTAQGAGWDCDDSAPTVTCSIGELATGAVAEIAITVTPGSAGTVSGVASVTADNADYERNLDNNSAAHSTTVTLP